MIRPSNVTPLAGVWIEMAVTLDQNNFSGSLPLRECGLKSQGRKHPCISEEVTPLAGVWIEILVRSYWVTKQPVTPLAGVWIEMTIHIYS